MAIPFALPTEDDAEAQGQQLEQLMLDLYAALQQVLRTRTSQHPSSRNHRIPRRAGDERHPMVLLDSDLSRVPLPDLVLSAVEQLPPPTPQVTVSAPSSPTRDAAFQFPECSGESSLAPVPSPRPRPRRRRLASESSGAATAKKTPPAAKQICNNCFGDLHTQAYNQNQWTNMGANLRNIADDFHASKTKAEEIEKSRLAAMNPGYASSGNSSTDSYMSLLILAPLRETLWTTVALYLGWRLVSHLR
ncbi:uncharacterized protein LOC108627444 [Ceratina calcarata]|uniref:Uncharacterized protein LOC108627444 n=1 Tax=Ceratina calcarata TaxID=156304 RepID=A0AAJ7N9C2_9HYME|nr:uncharacterized protein LOC108627444 [Ceratina calcarata]XP_026671400.1 uncharacterized protein LOC108627444 [Ceratina calcarata]